MGELVGSRMNASQDGDFVETNSLKASIDQFVEQKYTLQHP